MTGLAAKQEKGMPSWGASNSMDARPPRRRLARAFMVFALAASGMGTIAACGHGPPAPSCGAGTQLYDGNCLTDASVNYIVCTKNKGFDFSSDVSGGLSGTFREIVGVSVSAAVNNTRKEDTPVALQAVKACLTLAEQAGQTAANDQAARQYSGQVDHQLQAWQQQQVNQTPHIKLSRSTAAAGETVTVTGGPFWANETVDISIGAADITQVRADGHGDFTVTITVTASAVQVGFPTDIVATGETSNESADSPFTRTR